MQLKLETKSPKSSRARKNKESFLFHLSNLRPKQGATSKCHHKKKAFLDPDWPALIDGISYLTVIHKTIGRITHNRLFSQPHHLFKRILNLGAGNTKWGLSEWYTQFFIKQFGGRWIFDIFFFFFFKKTHLSHSSHWPGKKDEWGYGDTDLSVQLLKHIIKKME